MNDYNGFTGKQRDKGQRIINKAIEEGKLQPLNTVRCIICGQDKGIRQYHNEDYSEENILEDVIPVCVKCHRRIHMDRNSPKYMEYMIKVFKGERADPVYNKLYWTEENDKPIIEDWKPKEE